MESQTFSLVRPVALGTQLHHGTSFRPGARPVPRSIGGEQQPSTSGSSIDGKLLAMVAVAGAVGSRGQPGKRRGLASGVAQRAAKVFIDGEAGTTGLQVYDRLTKHPEIEILSLPQDQRKDEGARRDALRTADAAVLCLPDDAAIAAVAMCGDADTVIVDASTAHRVDDGWTYGFAELAAGHAEKIASSKRIANPGCYPTGFIGLIRPLVDAAVLPKNAELVVHAVSGYSGGGKPLIALYEGDEPHEPWGAYGFNLAHKHLPEMAKCTGLDQEPIFCPSVGSFAQGMVVSVPLRVSQLVAGKGIADVHAAITAHYAGKKFVTVAALNPDDKLERGAFLRPDTVNDTNNIELFVFGNEDKGTMCLCARLDNLGKGASGACVQNLNLALGFDEATGL